MKIRFWIMILCTVLFVDCSKDDSDSDLSGTQAKGSMTVNGVAYRSYLYSSEYLFDKYMNSSHIYFDTNLFNDKTGLTDPLLLEFSDYDVNSEDQLTCGKKLNPKVDDCRKAMTIEAIPHLNDVISGSITVIGKDEYSVTLKFNKFKINHHVSSTWGTCSKDSFITFDGVWIYHNEAFYDKEYVD